MGKPHEVKEMPGFLEHPAGDPGGPLCLALGPLQVPLLQGELPLLPCLLLHRDPFPDGPVFQLVRFPVEDEGRFEPLPHEVEGAEEEPVEMGGHPVLGIPEKVPVRLAHSRKELVEDVVAVHQHHLSREPLDGGLFELEKVPEVHSHAGEKAGEIIMLFLGDG